eukprot:TRINITY_DN29876_c0_g1_i1.p1 TRINITY_DN29876_c0_g1~~TRINITY_DN29876_c0_g1_i1.p1  ORF type:complete len:312 (-),score=75.73 TRINITY_DN29876_c0_g1_i1:273-1208(-)
MPAATSLCGGPPSFSPAVEGEGKKSLKSKTVAPHTNSMVVTHPLLQLGGNGFDLAAAMFRQFGDLASLEPLLGEPGSANVIFYDVRAAGRLQKQLESMDGWSVRPALPKGKRTVRLPGTMQLRPEDVQNVINIRKEPNSADGAFTVEFCDLRAAFAMQARLAAAANAAAVTAARAEAPKEATQVVRIAGLPNTLLTQKNIQAVIQQAGLASSVTDFATTSGDPCGHVSLRLNNAWAVGHCLQHFNGREWDASGTKVTASLVGSANEAWTRFAAAASPWPGVLMSGGTTEASTEADFSERDHDDREGEEAAA